MDVDKLNNHFIAIIRELSANTEAQKNLTKEVAEANYRISNISDRVDSLESDRDKQRGALKMLTFIGLPAGTGIGAFVGRYSEKLSSFIKGIGPW